MCMKYSAGDYTSDASQTSSSRVFYNDVYAHCGYQIPWCVTCAVDCVFTCKYHLMWVDTEQAAKLQALVSLPYSRLARAKSSEIAV